MLYMALAIGMWIIAVQENGWGVLWLLAAILGVPLLVPVGCNIKLWLRDAK